jgi:hypothetical protein
MQFFNLITFVLRKSENWFWYGGQILTNFQPQKQNGTLCHKSPVLYLNIAKFVKMIFWRKFTTSQHSFFSWGAGQLSISVLQFGQFCTNVSPTNNAKYFF